MAVRRGAVRAGLLGVAVAALLGGCGDGGGGGDEPDTPTTTAVPRTLRLGIAPVESLDPALASPDSPSASIVADLLYDGLPALSAAIDSSDGGRRWTFTLDEDLSFSDGSPIVAADAVASLERVRAAGAASLPATRLDVVRSISAPDPATVVVELARPLATLPELLDAPAYGIVPPVPAEGDAVDGSVGSGPFRLREAEDDRVVLVPGFGRRVAASRIELRQFDDLGAAARAFEGGTLDWTLVSPLSARDPDVVATPFQGELFYGFNLTDPMFADERFRQAIVQAIDREEIAAEVYDGVAVPLAGIVPDGVEGADPARCAAGCAHDPERSRLLLDEAFPDVEVPEVPIDFPEGDDETAVAAHIAEQLAAVGIPTVLRPHRPEAYVTFLLSGRHGFASLGWIGVAPTADDYVGPLFRTDSPDNLTGFSDEEVDALLDEGRAATAEARVLEQAAVAPLAQFLVLTLQADDMVGLQLTVDGTFDPTTANVR